MSDLFTPSSGRTDMEELYDSSTEREEGEGSEEDSELVSERERDRERMRESK